MSRANSLQLAAAQNADDSEIGSSIEVVLTLACSIPLKYARSSATKNQLASHGLLKRHRSLLGIICELFLTRISVAQLRLQVVHGSKTARAVSPQASLLREPRIPHFPDSKLLRLCIQGWAGIHDDWTELETAALSSEPKEGRDCKRRNGTAVV